MKSNERRHFSRNTVAKVTTNRVSHHFPQLLEGLGLGSNSVAQSGGNVPTVGFIFVNFKDDFAHKGNAILFSSSKQVRCTNRREP
jgi:hypothetical protein